MHELSKEMKSCFCTVKHIQSKWFNTSIQFIHITHIKSFIIVYNCVTKKMYNDLKLHKQKKPLYPAAMHILHPKHSRRPEEPFA